MHHEPKPIIFAIWCESEGERGIVIKFYELLRNLLSKERTVWIIGFNILRFDIPLLILKGIQYGISSVFELWHRVYVEDERQVLLPLSGFIFKGLNMRIYVNFLEN